MKIVLISCSATKQQLPPGAKVAAKDLYISSLFKKAWQYAQLLSPDKIFILSAKHALLKPTDMIETYNQSLTNASTETRKEWTNKVLSSLEAEGINLAKDEIIILAGKSYWQHLAPKLGNVQLPYVKNNCRGIGCMLRFLNNQLTRWRN